MLLDPLRFAAISGVPVATACASFCRVSLHQLYYVIFEVFTATTVTSAIFWDIKTQFVLHRRQITSPLQSQPLMICKKWRFPAGDYEEYRLLGYKNPVRTSQETHYLSRDQPVNSIQITVFHGSDYEECCLLGCGAVSLFRNRRLVPKLFSPWRWRRYIPPKRRFLQEPHAITSHNT
jgi:hypothetical protein